MENKRYYKIENTVIIENGKISIVPKVVACKKAYNTVEEVYKLYKERVECIRKEVRENEKDI